MTTRPSTTAEGTATATDTATLATAEAEVRAHFEKNRLAWADTDAYGATFTEDADYVTFFGGRMRGRHEIEEGHRGLFEGVLKGSRLWAAVDSVVLPAPDVALVHARGGVLKGRRTRPSARARSVQTYVMVRGADGEWLIRAFQNTRRRPRVEAFSNWLAGFAPKQR
ncbi:SgcJ/EcaC family oxidoreductase [Streptomyces sp. NPDC004111]|uniref:SgcJ/EcaC family oxidoreductase n=1 Tax=Streptomyces sp. NPDC004111 TaxID=3364690 RepID=UPI0036A99D0C